MISNKNTSECKLLDFTINDENTLFDDDEELNDTSSSNDEETLKEGSDEEKAYEYKKKCKITMFGIDENRNTYCLHVHQYKPFFYLKINYNKSITKKIINTIEKHIYNKVGDYYKNSIYKCEHIKKTTLYTFDNKKEYSFIKISFHNIAGFCKVRKLFVKENKIQTKKSIIQDKTQNINEVDYILEEEFDEEHFSNKNRTYHMIELHEIKGMSLELYEATLPPLLRFFHEMNIKPSGWIQFSTKNSVSDMESKSRCKFEYNVDAYEIVSLVNKETSVPYKICSFDIEALSSHGDFPQACKDYKTVVKQILQYFEVETIGCKTEEEIEEFYIYMQNILIYCISNCNDMDDELDNINIDKVFLKTNKPTRNMVIKLTNKLKKSKVCSNYYSSIKKYKFIHEVYYDFIHKKVNKDDTIELWSKLFNKIFPEIRGDQVTFIGSTFMYHNQSEPYLNHCITLDDCDKDIFDDKTEIVCKDNERDVLLEWTKIIIREDPDIIIGYNIFGFDYSFMIERIYDLDPTLCSKFLNISRLSDDICGTYNKKKKIYEINNKSLTIASGTHNLSYIQMTGRLQLDLYNFFRRDYNLDSYKLDHVSGYFIRNKIKKVDGNKIYSSSEGLKEGFYIHIEEIGHSSDYYENGSKFKITGIYDDYFTVDKQDISPDFSKKVIWCLAKDDVTPQDIFDMTRQGPDKKAIIAKYCIQDCNLVQYLMKKIDVFTGFIEMANLCNVPIEYLIMRGQGIKLFSFISKKCNEQNTLIPVLNKKSDGGYEGAIVLDPKCNLYLDEPVACVDYSSLYPSSMISENISHDSKVWTKTYNMKNELIHVEGITDEKGEFVYDNMKEYKYVDIEYDNYDYMSDVKYKKFIDSGYDDNILKEKEYLKTVTKKKVKIGTKHTRYVQFNDDEKAIMPTILQQLLKARKQTRTKAKYKKITTSIGIYEGLIIEKTDNHITLKDSQNKIKIIEQESIQNIEDSYDTFMKNILDKRQLAFKLTANSLYGQCGAKTSSFYEQDVAACTTAIGRKLLTYGKRIIEDIYGDRVCETKYGKVHSHAEYIYGDSVVYDTPILLRKSCVITDTTENEIMMRKNVYIEKICNISKCWKDYEEFKPFDTYKSNRREKEQNKTNINDIEIWTKNGWKKINRVIRHKCNKRIFRVETNMGIMDVTEDHSLINEKGEYIKPNELKVGDVLYKNQDYLKIDELERENETMNTSILSNNFISKNVISYFMNSKYYDDKEIFEYYFNDNMYMFMNKMDTFHYLLGIWSSYMIDFGYIFNINTFNNVNINNDNDNDNMIVREMSFILICIYTKVFGDYFKLTSTNEIICMNKDIQNKMIHIYNTCKDDEQYNIVPKSIMNIESTKTLLYYISGYEFGSKLYMSMNNTNNMNTSNIYIKKCVTHTKYQLSQIYYILEKIGLHKSTESLKNKFVCNIYLKNEYKPNTKCIVQNIKELCDMRRVHSVSSVDNMNINNSINSDDEMMYSVTDLNIKNNNDEYENEYVYDIETEDGTFNCGFPIIIKNTDSVFMSFKLTDIEGKKLDKKDALKHTIELAKEAGQIASKFLKDPHDLEYEKTFLPFCLLSKKRYVGMLYEDDPDVCYRKSMGIVLKRRDNAPIVKDIYGGIIDILMKDQDVNKSITFTKKSLEALISEKIQIEKLIISKSLRSYYKNPMQIAHYVLAERMGKRDPGTKPKTGDRLPYVYIVKKAVNKSEKILQGDKIEHPEYIKDNKLKIDYGFYVTNQIMKPVLQVYALVLEEMDDYNKIKSRYENEVKLIHKNKMINKDDKIRDIREKYVKQILFDPYIRKIECKQKSQMTLDGFFRKI
jgi:DNA polymerase elongation subunit (family B)